MIVVVPSNRHVSPDYLDPLLDRGHRIIVVDDSPGSVQRHHPDFEIYNWEDRKRILGDADAFFPRRNGACRDFGFYLAWRDADDDEIIVALDDDCEVTDRAFPDLVANALSPGERPTIKSAGRHANILDAYSDVPDNLFPRGFPYEARVGYERWEAAPAEHGAPAFNLGLWTDAFDVNGIDKIMGPQWRHPDARLRNAQVSVPAGVLVSVCSMNMQFRNRLTPAAYQWPMHVPAMPGWVIDRYGDIWGGFALKLLMDRNGDQMTFGEPMIAHRKAGDMNRNIWQEHIAHYINAELIDLLVAASEDAPADGYLNGMAALGEGMRRRADRASPWLRAYLAHLTPCIDAWVATLRRARAR